MKFEAIVTCVGYADFLAQTLPHNRVLFDRIVVVTAPEDHETQKICEFWHVQCVQSDRFGAHWARFEKGKGINDGLSALDKTDWLVHMDADILLPPLFRKIFMAMDLDPTYIYGIDRMMCASYGDWQKFIAAPRLQQENETWMHLDAFPVGVRVMHAHQWAPIGFTQIWNAGSGVLAYPENHGTAARTDMQFAEQWPRNRRGFIPEIVAYHLESEPAPMGANWNGRATRAFTPDEGY